eukprot:SAG11_NODE_3350_length_2507_cov_3.084302_6_plen_148_part_00
MPLNFFLNGDKVTLADHEVHPRMTLLDYLREKTPLSGTKLSCNQGGCGACTVTLTVVNKTTGAHDFKAVNACLRPLLSMDGQAVTTTEGIGRLVMLYHIHRTKESARCSCVPDLYFAWLSQPRRRLPPRAGSHRQVQRLAGATDDSP